MTNSEIKRLLRKGSAKELRASLPEIDAKLRPMEKKKKAAYCKLYSLRQQVIRRISEIVNGGK